MVKITYITVDSIYNPNKPPNYELLVNPYKGKNVLILFSDCYEYNTSGLKSESAGVLRPYNMFGYKKQKGYTQPFTCGIPTYNYFTKSSFDSLDNDSKHINNALKRIQRIIKRFEITQIIFFADKNGIFIGDLYPLQEDIRKFITKQIYLLNDEVREDIIIVSNTKVDNEDLVPIMEIPEEDEETRQRIFEELENEINF